MPIYEYECSQCHQTSDALQKVNDPAPETCPRCGARNTLSRLVSRTSFVLKGGGWYADLYSSSKSKPDAKPETKKDGGESKPAAKPEGGGSSAASSSGSGSSGTGSGGSSGPVNSSPKVAAAKA